MSRATDLVRGAGPFAVLIRPCRADDANAVWTIIEPIVRAGETYALDPAMSRADGLAYWLDPGKETFVAEAEGHILGTYYLRPNQDGGRRHVCNCGFMTASAAAGRGIAWRMCEHALAHAHTRGYRAMQFNFVVATNERAIRLWQALGFTIVGRLPEAFLHPRLGFVDALVMSRAL